MVVLVVLVLVGTKGVPERGAGHMERFKVCMTADGGRFSRTVGRNFFYVTDMRDDQIRYQAQNHGKATQLAEVTHHMPKVRSPRPSTINKPKPQNFLFCPKSRGIEFFCVLV